MLIRALDLYTLAVQATSSLPSSDQELLEDIIKICCYELRRVISVEPQQDIIQRKWTWILHENPVFTVRILREIMLRSDCYRDEGDYLEEEYNKLLVSSGRPPLSSTWRIGFPTTRPWTHDAGTTETED